MTIQELREKRSKAWDTARDFLDSKRNESGLLSEEDSKEQAYFYADSEQAERIHSRRYQDRDCI